MPETDFTFVLGSRSPRRLELLRLLLPETAIEVVPPLDSDEMGFDDLHDFATIQTRLQKITRIKYDDVIAQRSAKNSDVKNSDVVMTADTVIVAEQPDGAPIVLGQPPDIATARLWFHNYLFGKTHSVLTGVCIAVPGKISGEQITHHEQITQSKVTFHNEPKMDESLEWYLQTKEPLGKAGGYAIQEAGSIFVSQITGSLTNIIGLPLETVRELFVKLNIDFY